MVLDMEACFNAVRARDRRFDGRFFVAVSPNWRFDPGRTCCVATTTESGRSTKDGHGTRPVAELRSRDAQAQTLALSAIAGAAQAFMQYALLEHTDTLIRLLDRGVARLWGRASEEARRTREQGSATHLFVDGVRTTLATASAPSDERIAAITSLLADLDPGRLKPKSVPHASGKF